MNLPPTRCSWPGLLFAGLGASLVLATLFVLTTKHQMPSPAAAPTPVPSSRASSFSPVVVTTDSASPSTTPTLDTTRATARAMEGAALIATKRAIEQQYQNERATPLARTQPPRNPSATAPLRTPLPTMSMNIIPRRAAGAGTIIENGQAPFPGMAYTFENQWMATVGNENLIVYAGLDRSDSSLQQGIVIVVGRSLDWTRETRPTGVYKTPLKAGRVRIADVDGPNGMQLALSTPTGVSFVFDVALGQFISQVVPPGLALPTAAPILPPIVPTPPPIPTLPTP